MLLGSSVVLIAGCAPGPRPIFEQRHPEIVWPPEPAPARIRHVGQLRCDADLKPTQKPFKRIGELLVGEEPPRQLYGPRSVVCVDGGRRVWIADPGGRCLHEFNLAQRSYRKVARLGQSPLLSPVDLCLGPEGSLYVCDSEAVAIYRLSLRDGTLIEALRLPEEIQRPAALVYDGLKRELLVVDAGAHDIKVLSPSGALHRIIGRRGSAPGEFNYPCDLLDDGDLIWVVDAGNQRVQGLTRAGESVIVIGHEGDAPGDLSLPKGIATDSDGHIYVVDARFENVQVFDRQGRLLLVFGEEGTGPGEFWLPAGIFIDANDRIWVCDSYNGRVQVFDYVKQAPAPGTGPAPDGLSAEKRDPPVVPATDRRNEDGRRP